MQDIKLKARKAILLTRKEKKDALVYLEIPAKIPKLAQIGKIKKQQLKKMDGKDLIDKITCIMRINNFFVLKKTKN